MKPSGLQSHESTGTKSCTWAIFSLKFGSSLRVKKHPNVSVKSGHVQWSVVCQLQHCELLASAFCGCRSLTSITIPCEGHNPSVSDGYSEGCLCRVQVFGKHAIPEPVTAIGGLCRVKDSILKVTDICSSTFVNEAQRASVSRKYWNKELYVAALTFASVGTLFFKVNRLRWANAVSVINFVSLRTQAKSDEADMTENPEMQFRIAKSDPKITQLLQFFSTSPQEIEFERK